MALDLEIRAQLDEGARVIHLPVAKMGLRSFEDLT